MGWNGIGIGWPNASAYSTPPLSLETYLISDCLGNQVDRWSQYLPVGTLQLDQRVPTTSSTEIATYGIVHEIGTTFGPLVAEPVANIYNDCNIQSNIQIDMVASGNDINFLATLISGNEIDYTFTGSIYFEAFAQWTDGEGGEHEEEINTIITIDLENHIIGTNAYLTGYEVDNGGYPITITNTQIFDLSLSPGFYNYGDADQTNSTQIITPEGDLWNWTYPGQY
jgi:hypothetical protein